jgi:uncharacterized protein (TIGR02300 family)
VAKPELGTKRICPETGRKFYDLNQSPVISPYTGKVVPIESPTVRGRPEVARPAAPEEAERTEVADAELVSLEEADADTSGKKAAVVDVDVDDADVDDDGDDDTTFLEESDDEDDDVSGIIGGDREDDEET